MRVPGLAGNPKGVWFPMSALSASKRIMYIGGGREAVETLEKVKSLGLEVVYIQRKGQFKDALLRYVDHVALIDYQDLDVLIPLAKTLQGIFPLTGAISMSEPALVPTAHVCAALGLPGNSVETVRLLKDKSLMRQRLNALGISPVAARVGRALADMSDFARERGLPIIVKPTDAGGSLGIFKIDDPAQLAEAWERVQELNLSCFLLEEYLDGPEISVESFTFHGRHMIL